jgi:hypothetical protein
MVEKARKIYFVVDGFSYSWPRADNLSGFSMAMNVG